MNTFDHRKTDALSLLDEHHQWPGSYQFKFILPQENKNTLLAEMGEHQVHFERPSKTGKYISLTIEKTFFKSQEVLDQYDRVRYIKGLISL